MTEIETYNWYPPLVPLRHTCPFRTTDDDTYYCIERDWVIRTQKTVVGVMIQSDGTIERSSHFRIQEMLSAGNRNLQERWTLRGGDL